MDFTKVRLLDKNKNLEKLLMINEGSFSDTDTDLQACEMDDHFAATPQFPYNWQHRSGSEPFTMKICCKALLLVSKDSGSLDAAKVIVSVDGKERKTVDPREVGWTHCNAQILFSEEECKEHDVVISVKEGDEDKLFTILGFGFVEE